MAMEAIPVTSRANRGLQILRELKTKPHRVLAAGPVYGEETSYDLFSPQEEFPSNQVLTILSKTGSSYQVELTQLSLSERTSNGSFVSDSISDEEVAAVWLEPASPYSSHKK